MSEIGWLRRRRIRRAERRSAPYPSVIRRVVSGVELLLLVVVSGLVLAIATGLIVVVALLVVDRTLAA